MKRIWNFIILCLFLGWSPELSGQNSPRLIAEQFFAKKLAENQLLIDFRFDEPVRYGRIWVFECRKPEGFVLVRESGTSRIVGYSTANRFHRGEMIPEPAVALLESLSDAPDSVPELKTGYRPVGPLIRTTWSQEGFFNFYCPEDPEGPDQHAYAGCAAVAMAQIIRYFGKFNDFQLNVTSEHTSYGILTATLGNHDWERMENRPITIDPEVSRLIYGLGVLLKMNFGPSGSGTSNYSVYDGFKKLKYFDAIRMVRSATAPDIWIRNFTQNISDFQPIYVSGSGHSFVCDGMDANGLFHFNLGWYGYADGYYPLSQLFGITPAEAIFGLKPYSNRLPPANLTLDTINGQILVKWEKNRLASSDPTLYRIYLNDTTYFETHETWYNPFFFPPGNHELMVTAIYPEGESSWIGPIQLAIQGNPVSIPDPALKIAILDELLRENIIPVPDFPTINQLLKINKLEIRQSIQSLEGLEYCHNIQMLTIAPPGHDSLDLGPVSLLRRLKWLDLQNIGSANSSLLANNDRLIHLGLSGSDGGDLGFLNQLTALISLNLNDIQVPDPQVISNLLTLKDLTVSGCNLSTAAFVQSLPELDYLDLSRNQLQRFRLNAKLPELTHLDISRNKVYELYFLEFIPNIESLNLGYNQINRFITGLNLSHIKELNLEHNAIDSISVVMPMPALERLSLNDNRIRTLRNLAESTPGLVGLDLSRNRIGEFWKGSLQRLKRLDFSNNLLTLMEDLEANPLLEHVDLSFNRLTDLYPVFDHSRSDRIQFLDLTGNPLTVESTADLAPYLFTVIDTLLLPDFPQALSPGNPIPARNRTVTGQNVELSWLTAQLPPNGYFEILTGSSHENITRAGQVASPPFLFDINPGQPYFWRVRTVLPDTSYISGLFNFVTYLPLVLPYEEDFENYSPFAYLSEQSAHWIRAYNGPTISTDGRIDPYRKYEGKQSLKINNATDLRLPLSHLYQSNLYISMQLLVEEGCYGAVRLNDINGASLELYFKSNNRCDILMDSKLISEVSYPESEWFTLHINLYSRGNGIMLQFMSNFFPIEWSYAGNIAHAGELELITVPGPNWPVDGQPLFHVDNLEINATGSVGIETQPIDSGISIYPNPASREIFLEIPSPSGRPLVILYDFTGSVQEARLTQEDTRKWKLEVGALPPGIYLISVSSGSERRVSRIYIE